MFAIGDKIVYPMHGVGVIEAVEQKEILGEVRDYYVLHIFGGDMRIMVPVLSSEDIGVRPVVDAETAGKALRVLAEPSPKTEGNWNKRHRENTGKLKTGDLFEVAEVLRNLLRQDRIKKLSTGEKRLLTNARQAFVSEIMLADGMTEEQVNRIIEETV